MADTNHPADQDLYYLNRLIDRIMMPAQAVTEHELRKLHTECASMLRRIPALESALKRANDQAERFEREWYLRGDQLEALEAERDQLHAEVMEQARLLGMSGERELALRAEIDRLRKDADRLDWLADPANTIGNVQLPRECVEQNLHSLRDAIDAARKLK